MTKFLIKFFIKDYTNIKEDSVREQYGILGSIVGIISNIILFLIKLVTGNFINSIAIIADSFNNLLDSIASVISLIGFKLSSKPADKEHPFGHGRIEYICSFLVSIFIIGIGLEFLKDSFKNIFEPKELNFNLYTTMLLGVTILVKIWLSVFNKKLGEIIKSNSLIATSLDAKNDVIITSISMLAIIIFRITGINLDGQFGLVVSIFLIISGVNLSKEMISPLLGEAVDSEIIDEIKEIVLKYREIRGVHDIQVHNYGANKNIGSLHVEIMGNMCIKEAHDIVDELENKIYEKIGINVTIHIDPV
ncbi:MAG: cation diffusion facilitator family transporter [bacterium]